MERIHLFIPCSPVANLVSITGLALILVAPVGYVISTGETFSSRMSIQAVGAAVLGALEVLSVLTGPVLCILAERTGQFFDLASAALDPDLLALASTNVYELYVHQRAL